MESSEGTSSRNKRILMPSGRKLDAFSKAVAAFNAHSNKRPESGGQLKFVFCFLRNRLKILGSK